MEDLFASIPVTAGFSGAHVVTLLPPEWKQQTCNVHNAPAVVPYRCCVRRQSLFMVCACWQCAMIVVFLHYVRTVVRSSVRLKARPREPRIVRGPALHLQPLRHRRQEVRPPPLRAGDQFPPSHGLHLPRWVR